jgi:hypothetical protein
MKRLRIAAVLAALAFSNLAQPPAEEAALVTLRGEVVDLH